MKLFRLSNKAYARDLQGTGSRLAGGRWNSIGKPVIYTSTSVPLCTLEILAQTSIFNIPENLALITLEIADTYLSKKVVDASELPSGWHRYPASKELQSMGDQWLAENDSLIMEVPSAIVPVEQCTDRNILINPLHGNSKHIRILSVVDYKINSRLLE